MGITSVFVPGGGEDQIAQWSQVRRKAAHVARNLGLRQTSCTGLRWAELNKQVRASPIIESSRRPIAVSSVKVYCEASWSTPQTAAMLEP